MYAIILQITKQYLHRTQTQLDYIIICINVVAAISHSLSQLLVICGRVQQVITLFVMNEDEFLGIRKYPSLTNNTISSWVFKHILRNQDAAFTPFPLMQIWLQ